MTTAAIAATCAVSFMAVLGMWIWWAVWTLDHNPHGHPDDEKWMDDLDD
jgi:hypothetical protein